MEVKKTTSFRFDEETISYLQVIREYATKKSREGVLGGPDLTNTDIVKGLIHQQYRNMIQKGLIAEE